METGGKQSNDTKSFEKCHLEFPSEAQTTSSSSLHYLKEPDVNSVSQKSHFGQRSKQSHNVKEEKTGVARNSGSFSGGVGKETSHDGGRREGPQFNLSAKATKSNSKGLAQARSSRESADGQLPGDCDPRMAPSSAQRPRPVYTNITHFEVKLADFPKLGGIPSAKLDSWTRSSQSPWMVCSKFPICKERLVIGDQPNKEDVRTTDTPVLVTAKNSSDVTPGAQTVTSWAVVASRPPKKAFPKEMEIRNVEQEEEIVAHQEEAPMSKNKRRKKKKKKPKDGSKDANEFLANQEPPKFEDEDEFPELNTAGFSEITHSTNASKLRDQKEPSEDGPHQSAHQLIEHSYLKSQPAVINKKEQKSEKTLGKKSKAPVQLDIGNMLAALEETHKSHKVKQDVKSFISVGGGLRIIPKQPQVQKKLPWLQEKIAHNPLDSTSPLVKKGKQREVPKAKKPTPLKKIILKEREERKQRRLLEEQGLYPEAESAQVSATVEEELSITNSADEESGNEVQKADESRTNDNTDLEQLTPTVTDSNLKTKVHSRKFRDYCSQMLSKEVDECVTALLKELVRFQDRLHQKDPMKARMKRRVVMGLREVLKHLKLGKVKCVIISPNCERVQTKGGLDEALHTIINTCREQEVPFIFALSRKALGRCLNKVVPVSLVGIFNYDGAQDHYHKMIELSSEARKAYEVMVCSLEQAEHEEAVDWRTANTEVKTNSQSFPGGCESSPPTLEEPEYIKMWKTLLKDCNHEVLDFQSRRMDSGAKCHADDNEPS